MSDLPTRIKYGKEQYLPARNVPVMLGQVAATRFALSYL